MKKMTSWFGAAVLGVALATGSVACAQANDNASATARAASYRGDHGDPAKNIDKRISRMKDKLGLTDAQVAQIKNIYAQNQAKMTQDFQNMKAATKGSDQAKAARTQMKADRTAVEAQVRGILNADQQAKWDQFRKEHQHKRGDEKNEKNESK